MKVLKIDEFLRSLKQNINTPHSLLLGAGASIESGVQSADDCIWDWKKEIFLSQNPTLIEHYSNTKAENVRKNIQAWLDAQGEYPSEGDVIEYSFYAEKTFPIEEDRTKYFQNLSKSAKPSLGYHIISCMAELGVFKSVWTTNFDGLVEKCAHSYNIAPISITADTAERFYAPLVDNGILNISLHGDYKYGRLKNTVNELDSQSEVLVKALSHELVDRDLIVIGYSGRDDSLMSALKRVYSSSGKGRLFWCGYGQNPGQSVCELIDFANMNQRTAYYIPCNGFDETMYSIARHCFSGDKDVLRKIEEIKTKLSSALEPVLSDYTSYKVDKIGRVIDTNLYPIIIPKNCYQFELKYRDGEKAWDFCRIIYDKGIMAVPFNGKVYAFAEKQNIVDVCQERIKSDINFTPLTLDNIEQITQFRELLLKTITYLLANNRGLKCSKSKIWDETQELNYTIEGKNIKGYKGVSISLIFKDNFAYITLSPSYVYEKDCVLTQEEKKQFADKFNILINNGRPNANVKSYINGWIKRLVGETNLSLNYPVNSMESVFVFKFGKNSANLKARTNNSYNIKLPTNISSNRLILSGVECFDPQLVFYNTQKGTNVQDFHPMRGLLQNAPVDIPLNLKNIKSSISLGVVCPESYHEKFYAFIAKLDLPSDVKFNVDYVIRYPGFFDAYKTNLDIPTTENVRWQKFDVTEKMSIKEFGETLTRKIDRLSASSVDVVLIYIPEEYEKYTYYTDGIESFDLHDYVKAYAAQKQISTQFVREKTIKSELLCQIMWALSLAIYVKSNRIPWLVSNTQKDTAFAGIGYSVQKSKYGTNVVIGCSHIYSSDGQGLKYKLSKISDVTYDKKRNPYLSENEAYRLGLNIKELFYNSFSEMPKRVVIHKRTPFQAQEIKGLVESLSSAGIKDIELLEITYEDNLKSFAYNKDLNAADGFPVRRGLCFALNKNTMFLYSHGIAPSIINPNRAYVQGGKTIPMPLKIVNHYGNSSMTQIATEILGLSKMNWNSFGLYTKLPCTIESSNEIARIGWLLSKYEGALYEYRFFM